VAERSRYRPGEATDYSHRFHAGNVGDVWKHCVLAETLMAIDRGARRVAYVESHAGAGSYVLGATGEWTEGIGKLWARTDVPSDAATRYLTLCRRLCEGSTRPERYPGSPRFARALLAPDATIALWERDAATCADLGADLAGDPRVSLVCDDGLAALPGALARAESTADAVVALVDPPWSQKADWIAVPDAVTRAAAVTARATIMLWYPVKSLTRPNAMVLRLRAAGVAGTLVELVTTPLEHQRHRLNGSGMLLVRPPAGLIEPLAASAAALGAVCATRHGVWSSRLVSWA
jgi:23S rRNA (adenine2030-N6)-methyltransferase